MSSNGLDDIPDDAQDLINGFSNINDTTKAKLVELWKLYEKVNTPSENPNYKPIDKYIVEGEDQAEGEFILFINQISVYPSNRITYINAEIQLYKQKLNMEGGLAKGIIKSKKSRKTRKSKKSKKTRKSKKKRGSRYYTDQKEK